MKYSLIFFCSYFFCAFTQYKDTTYTALVKQVFEKSPIAYAWRDQSTIQALAQTNIVAALAMIPISLFDNDDEKEALLYVKKSNRLLSQKRLSMPDFLKAYDNLGINHALELLVNAYKDPEIRFFRAKITGLQGIYGNELPNDKKSNLQASIQELKTLRLPQDQAKESKILIELFKNSLAYYEKKKNPVPSRQNILMSIKNLLDEKDALYPNILRELAYSNINDRQKIKKSIEYLESNVLAWLKNNKEKKWKKMPTTILSDAYTTALAYYPSNHSIYPEKNALKALGYLNFILERSDENVLNNTGSLFNIPKSFDDYKLTHSKVFTLLGGLYEYGAKKLPKDLVKATYYYDQCLKHDDAVVAAKARCLYKSGCYAEADKLFDKVIANENIDAFKRAQALHFQGMIALLTDDYKNAHKILNGIYPTIEFDTDYPVQLFEDVLTPETTQKIQLIFNAWLTQRKLGIVQRDLLHYVSLLCLTSNKLIKPSFKWMQAAADNGSRPSILYLAKSYDAQKNTEFYETVDRNNKIIEYLWHLINNGMQDNYRNLAEEMFAEKIQNGWLRAICYKITCNGLIAENLQRFDFRNYNYDHDRAFALSKKGDNKPYETIQPYLKSIEKLIDKGNVSAKLLLGRILTTRFHSDLHSAKDIEAYKRGIGYLQEIFDQNSNNINLRNCLGALYSSLGDAVFNSEKSTQTTIDDASFKYFVRGARYNDTISKMFLAFEILQNKDQLVKKYFPNIKNLSHYGLKLADEIVQDETPILINALQQLKIVILKLAVTHCFKNEMSVEFRRYASLYKKFGGNDDDIEIMDQNINKIKHAKINRKNNVASLVNQVTCDTFKNAKVLSIGSTEEQNKACEIFRIYRDGGALDGSIALIDMYLNGYEKITYTEIKQDLEFIYAQSDFKNPNICLELEALLKRIQKKSQLSSSRQQSINELSIIAQEILKRRKIKLL